MFILLCIFVNLLFLTLFKEHIKLHSATLKAENTEYEQGVQFYPAFLEESLFSAVQHLEPRFHQHCVGEHFHAQLLEENNDQKRIEYSLPVTVIPNSYTALLATKHRLLESNASRKYHEKLIDWIVHEHENNRSHIIITTIHLWITCKPALHYPSQHAINDQSSFCEIVLNGFRKHNVWILHFEAIPLNMVIYQAAANKDLNLGTIDKLKYYPFAVPVPYLSTIPKKQILSSPDFGQWEQRSTSVYFRGNFKRRTDLRAEAATLDHSAISNVLIVDVEVNGSNPIEYKMQMSNSKFCLFIRGDTPSSSRFYDIVALQCIPIIISDYWLSTSAPYTNIIEYEKFCFFIKEKEFRRNATLEIQKILEAQHDRIRLSNMLAYMVSVQRDLLWNVDGSRVAHNSVQTVVESAMKRKSSNETFVEGKQSEQQIMVLKSQTTKERRKGKQREKQMASLQQRQRAKARGRGRGRGRGRVRGRGCDRGRSRGRGRGRFVHPRLTHRQRGESTQSASDSDSDDLNESEPDCDSDHSAQGRGWKEHSDSTEDSGWDDYKKDFDQI